MGKRFDRLKQVLVELEIIDGDLPVEKAYQKIDKKLKSTVDTMFKNYDMKDVFCKVEDVRDTLFDGKITIGKLNRFLLMMTSSNELGYDTDPMNFLEEHIHGQILVKNLEKPNNGEYLYYRGNLDIKVDGDYDNKKDDIDKKDDFSGMFTGNQKGFEEAMKDPVDIDYTKYFGI